jgi:hypothetical protein
VPGGIYRRHAEHVREERTDLRSIRGEHDRIHPSDHAAILTGRWPVAPPTGAAARASHSQPSHSPTVTAILAPDGQHDLRHDRMSCASRRAL